MSSSTDPWVFFQRLPTSIFKEMASTLPMSDGPKNGLLKLEDPVDFLASEAWVLGLDHIVAAFPRDLLLVMQKVFLSILIGISICEILIQVQFF